MYKLRLYVAGQTPKAEKAFEDLKALCEDGLNGPYAIEVIDILEHPELAAEDKILASPTVIKILPAPIRRVLGDLSAKEKVLVALRLTENG